MYKDIQTGVSIAVLGSVILLAATTLQQVDFINEILRKYIFISLILSAILILTSSASYIYMDYYSYAFSRKEKVTFDIFFKVLFGFGIALFFGGMIFTLSFSIVNILP